MHYNVTLLFKTQVLKEEDRKKSQIKHNLMFFWPCIMNWLYINYQLDALTIIYS